MGRTAPNCAPVGKEGSAIQQLGGVCVPLGGWDSHANKVIKKKCGTPPLLCVFIGASVNHFITVGFIKV